MTTEEPRGDAPAFHATGAEAVLARLDVETATGLSEREVRERRERWGENRLAAEKRTGLLAMLARQFANVMIVVLMAAAVVTAVIGDAVDAIAIVVILVLNAIIGLVQEYRAERALQALQSLSAPSAWVRRGGETMRIPEEEVVPGDIVLLEAGNVVPADLRIVETADLTVDESALTGESVPVVKEADAPVSEDAVLGDRTTMAYRGTSAVSGRAVGVAVATGGHTELGRIARLMRSRERPMTPLQKRLSVFGRRLSIAILAVCVAIFLIGMMRGEPPLLMLLTAVSLAVAAVPEALPAVVTIALALGARRMANLNALIRRLPAVETLGSVTTICCDKTGTLTRNAMRAERFFAAGEERETLPAAGEADPVWAALCRAMALNTDASLDADGGGSGDPTEVALLEAAHAAGFSREDTEADWPRTGEIPFEAARRRMATLHGGTDGTLIVVKGAPEAVLPLCETGPDGGGEKAPFDRDGFLETADDLAARGYRVIAFAERRAAELPPESDAEAVERDLAFLGMVALADPPRPEVEDALAACRSAGIRVAMITGDHPTTARAIAADLNICEADAPVTTGEELEALADDERQEAISASRVFARVSPEQKFDIVTALQAHGQFVAMTGDGVNDAPALKQADIGVAMGQKGTDVAREAADAVLLDDNFATIVAAIREGRRIYDNIRKFIKYTMTSNTGEILTILMAPLLGLPLPLLPIQILWINLVTDGLPGLALGAERAERNIMDRPPRPPDESVFARGYWQQTIWVGCLIAALSLGAQYWAWHNGSENWQTMVFTVLTFSQLVNAIAVRSERDSVFLVGWFTNPLLLGSVVLTVALQFAIIYLPPLQTVFSTGALSGEEILVALVLPWVVLVANEIEKVLIRRGLLYQARNTAAASPAPAQE